MFTFTFYVYILGWQFGEFLKTMMFRSNSVTREVTFNITKICGKCKIEKFKCDIIFKQCGVGQNVFVPSFPGMKHPTFYHIRKVHRGWANSRPIFDRFPHSLTQSQHCRRARIKNALSVINQSLAKNCCCSDN